MRVKLFIQSLWGKQTMFQLNISALCGAVLTILLSFPSLSDAAMGDTLIPSDRKATLYAHPTLKADKVANISRKQSAIELEKTGAWVLVAVETFYPFFYVFH